MNFSILPPIVIFIWLFIIQVDAFCVYNKVEQPPGTPETTFQLRQEPLHAGFNYFARFFRKKLEFGGKACCPFASGDCVKSKTSNEILYMAVTRTTGILEYGTVRISFPAGGWIEFHGDEKPENYEIKVFNANGSPFKYEWKHNFMAGTQ
ncbi:hypothetical protein BD408DRAFT_433551 [Parasitella parasitica]|nr:hypothetical protein BD408DRAFT_433551 [Parasitella parasitica]